METSRLDNHEDPSRAATEAQREGHRSTTDIDACPFCSGRGRHLLTAYDRNRETSDARFLYDRCEQCGSVFLTNVPSDLHRYYDGGYYAFRPDGGAEWQDDDFIIGNEACRVELLLRHVAPGHLIEIGAGTGGFAFAARQAGFDVTAIEMDARCCAYLTDQIGVRAVCSDRPLEALATLPKARVLAMWHVLEHLPNPADILAAARECLEPGGLLAIGVPNPRSLQFRLLRSRWAHLDAPRHLILIPASALIERTNALGLSCVEFTTDDLYGRHFNVHGWSYALHPRPGAEPANPRSRLGLTLARLARPIERRGERGSAFVMLLRREPTATT